MNQKHLLKFIKKKMRTEGTETVLFRDNKHYTLSEVFDSLGLTVDTISVDTLEYGELCHQRLFVSLSFGSVHADHATFHRVCLS